MGDLWELCRDQAGNLAQEKLGVWWRALMLDPEHSGRLRDLLKIRNSSLNLLQRRQQEGKRP